ncbi:MAG: glycosyltransferase family 4 protein [Lactobacillales bacterium]|jgi:glycosyltransferase involved in cell wall biosynthesis|nr:glycosyltransferase family 4 protein [Lactobacillales bacterium]
MKQKVLLIAESLGGGLRKHVVQLIEGLDDEKFDVFLIHGTLSVDNVFQEKKKDLEKKAVLIECPHLVREINPSEDISAYNFISQWIKTNKPDVVHLHSSKAGVIGRMAAKRRGVKKVFYTPHAYSFQAKEFSKKKKALFIFIERFLSRYATTKTFNVSEGEKEAALQVNIDKPDKFQVIYNGLPEIELPTKKEARDILGLSQEAFIIGNNARLSEQKDPLTFVKIAKEVVKENSKALFVWVGDGPLQDEVEKYIDENNLQKNVKLLGFREDSELIVSAYDIFLLTSLYEGLPYAPIEALRAGVPVVATDVTGNREVVKNTVNGLLYKQNDIDQAASSIVCLQNDLMNIIDQYNLSMDYVDRFSIKKMMKQIKLEYL